MVEGVFWRSFWGSFWGVFGVLDKCLNSSNCDIRFLQFGGVFGSFLGVLEILGVSENWSRGVKIAKVDFGVGRFCDFGAPLESAT